MTADWRRIARPWDFVGAVWIAIATVLICAVAPAGLPQTTQLGSAFNPATTIVALNSGTGSARLLAKRTIRGEAPDTDAAATPAIAAFVLPGSAAQIPARIGSKTALFLVLAASPVRPRFRAQPWQTGPPAA